MNREIRGHRAIISHLLRGLEEGRLGHSYLFTGREGIGKKRVALWFAGKVISLGISPKLQKNSEERVFKGIHPDVMVVKPQKGIITIGQIREAQDWLSILPMEGSRKVLILDDAHNMRTEAANAFLKSLEEPPTSSLIILVTSHHCQLLTTILSRCQVIRFSPLKVEEVRDALIEMGTTEKEAKELARHSFGSLSRALELKEGKEEELLQFARGLYEGLSIHDIFKEIGWKKERETVKRLLNILRVQLREKMAESKQDPRFWERHLTLAKLEESLYQYNVDPRLIVEYLELKWREMV